MCGEGFLFKLPENQMKQGSFFGFPQSINEPYSRSSGFCCVIPGPNNISMVWDLVRNAGSQAHPAS
jgi:hypothetical protein